MAQVKLNKITKIFPGDVKVVHGVDLEIKDGEFIVFVGPSGCGKSTMLRMIAGLEDITSGELVIGNSVANDIPPSKRGVAMVFQSYALYPHMTVYANMAFGLKLSGAPKAEIDAVVKRAAEILQITHLLDRKPKALSGGQRQRVAIGRAIVRKPVVFLFDEPLSNLDASLRVQMRIELSKLHDELKTTMIYVTHDQVEAMTLGDRIVVFNAGHIEQVGTPLDLYHNPSNLFVAGFLGSPQMNFMQCTLMRQQPGEVTVQMKQGYEITLPYKGSETLAARGELTMGIRPEHLELSLESGGIEGKVDLVEHLGDNMVCYVEIAGIEDMVSIKLDGGHQVLKPGQKVFLSIASRHCHLFNRHGKALQLR